MRKATDLFMFQIMLLVCIIWGLQQIAIKLAAPDIANTVQACLRAAIAALLLLIVVYCKGGWQQTWRGTLKAGLMVGLFSTGDFLFIALGLQYTTAAHMTVFLYTAPVFSALGLHFWVASERLVPLQWLGVGICLVGILIAFGGGISLQEINSTVLLGDALGLLAGASWGATTVAVRASRLSEAPASLTLFYQLFVTFLLLLILALVTKQFEHFQLTPIAVASILFQGVVVSFISYLIWFWLMKHYLANNLAILSFMTPVFGVIFGVIILGEKITYNFIIGAICILIGITLVSGASLINNILKKLYH